MSGTGLSLTQSRFFQSDGCLPTTTTFCWGGSMAVFSGSSESPLILAFHPWMVRNGDSFSSRSGILEWCQANDWSLYAPTAFARNWTARHAANSSKLVADARKSTQSIGPLILVGFSDGGTMVHRSLSALLAGGISVAGAWAHSCPFPKDLAQAPFQTAIVCVSCNFDETAKLFRLGFPWYSMLDYRQQAVDWYKGSGCNCHVFTGHESGHNWDRLLNSQVFGRIVQ